MDHLDNIEICLFFLLDMRTAQVIVIVQKSMWMHDNDETHREKMVKKLIPNCGQTLWIAANQ